MIIWLASYPKSGNTWVRTIINQIIFNDVKSTTEVFDNLSRIRRYPSKTDIIGLPHLPNNNIFTKEHKKEVIDFTIKNWSISQDKINKNNKTNILKTHNILCKLNLDGKNYSFTDLNNTIGVIHIVRDQAQYFIPQIQTKIMNEGWASYWHYTLMHDLELPQNFHIPFIKSHNQVIRPHVGGLNPYHVGFFMFQKIKERYGIEECFLAREVSNDVSFLRQYMTEEDCAELGLFSFSRKKEHYEIDEISDVDGWKVVKQNLLSNIGTTGIPVIYADDIEEGNVLVLKHEHDGRDLDLQYSDEVIMHVSDLWGDVVKFHTIVEGESWEI